VCVRVRVCGWVVSVCFSARRRSVGRPCSLYSEYYEHSRGGYCEYSPRVDRVGGCVELCDDDIRYVRKRLRHALVPAPQRTAGSAGTSAPGLGRTQPTAAAAAAAEAGLSAHCRDAVRRGILRHYYHHHSFLIAVVATHRITIIVAILILIMVLLILSLIDSSAGSGRPVS
jgi:hypothetical protein